MQTQQLLGLTLVPTSLIGVVCNGLVLFATWRSRSLSHSFSLLTANQALINGVHSTTFLLYVMPMYVLDSEILKTNSHHCGFILLVCYDVSMYAHFLITINRFCAVFLPITYRTLFNSTRTNAIIVFTYLLSLSVYTVFFQILPCHSSYNEDRWAFYYNNIPLCWKFGLYDAAKVSSLAFFNVIVDMITITKVRRTRNLVRSGQPENAAVKKKELDFLKQSFSQSIFLLIAMLSLFIVPMLTSWQVMTFIVGNVFWSLLHALDGVLTLIFNSEVRKSLWKSKSRVSSQTMYENKSKTSMAMK